MILAKYKKEKKSSSAKNYKAAATLNANFVKPFLILVLDCEAQ